jgi:hypothetical protein
MKKNKIETGSIIKIPLEHDLGFVLAKFINLKQIEESIGYNEFIYVYNRVFKDEEIVVEGIDDNDLLLGGVYVLNPYPALKNKTWEIVGLLKPKTIELQILDFKDFGPVFTLYEKEAKIWYYIHNGEVNNRVVTDYEKVKHLETFVYRGKTYILNGHHRIEAAKNINATIEAVELSAKSAYAKYASKVEEIIKGLH